MNRNMKPENGFRSEESGAIRVEFEDEYQIFPGDLSWAMDSKALTIFDSDGSIRMYPIHRVVSVEDDRGAVEHHI